MQTIRPPGCRVSVIDGQIVLRPLALGFLMRIHQNTRCQHRIINSSPRAARTGIAEEELFDDFHIPAQPSPAQPSLVQPSLPRPNRTSSLGCSCQNCDIYDCTALPTGDHRGDKLGIRATLSHMKYAVVRHRVSREIREMLTHDHFPPKQFEQMETFAV